MNPNYELHNLFYHHQNFSFTFVSLDLKIFPIFSRRKKLEKLLCNSLIVDGQLGIEKFHKSFALIKHAM